MNLDKKIFETISHVTGIPESNITQDKFFAKDLGVTETEIADILSELTQNLGFEVKSETKEVRTVQDLLILVHNSQLLT